ncbi:hypothetical protein PoB_006754500 [Plakobranchus ocellatus]|uniref:Uncharacterized protein n=1 Tax=Plakobranchus ocellatus TaxID=259542 RepID=A0AAV4DAR4_9GAST|nr:hypothetical protein PoB_006754500 [Plakobranchus ocellatus]
MFFAPSKSSGGGTAEQDVFLDGSCWESARSSWIYMEMEPRQRPCTNSSSCDKSSESPFLAKEQEPLSSKCPEEALAFCETSEIRFSCQEHDELKENCSVNSDFRFNTTFGSGPSTTDTTWSPDTSRDENGSDLKFIHGRTSATEDSEEDQQQDECDYEEIEDFSDEIDLVEHDYAVLSNDNFVLQRDENQCRVDPFDVVTEKSGCEIKQERTCLARRSVSLDMVKPPKLSLRHSETVPFPPAGQAISRALPPVPVPSQAKLSTPPVSPAPVSLTAPFPPCSVIKIAPPPLRPGHLPWIEADGVSISTLGAFSTTTSSGSLYRIPAKIRKLSTSTSKTTNTNTTSSPGQASSCSVRTCDSSGTSTTSGGSFSHVAIDVLNGTKRSNRSSSFTTSKLPQIIREVFSFLWSDNPDRDPFNTFSVSETDLTFAIAHLESQLSSSVRSCNMGSGNKTRASLFTSFAKAETDEVSAMPSENLCTSPLGDGHEATPKQESRAHGSPVDRLPFRVQFIMESYCNIFMMSVLCLACYEFNPFVELEFHQGKTLPARHFDQGTDFQKYI